MPLNIVCFVRKIYVVIQEPVQNQEGSHSPPELSTTDPTTLVIRWPTAVLTAIWEPSHVTRIPTGQRNQPAQVTFFFAFSPSMFKTWFLLQVFFFHPLISLFTLKICSSCDRYHASETTSNQLWWKRDNNNQNWGQDSGQHGHTRFASKNWYRRCGNKFVLVHNKMTCLL